MDVTFVVVIAIATGIAMIAVVIHVCIKFKLYSCNDSEFESQSDQMEEPMESYHAISEEENEGITSDSDGDSSIGNENVHTIEVCADGPESDEEELIVHGGSGQLRGTAVELTPRPMGATSC